MVTEPCGSKSNLLLLCLYAHKSLGVKGCKVEKDYQHHRNAREKDVVQISRLFRDCVARKQRKKIKFSVIR